MRIATYVSFDMETFFDEGKVVYERNEGYETDACVHQCKKGRGAQQQNTQFQQQEANQFGNNANNAFNSANGFYQSELALNPGGMSAPAAAMYSSDLNAINSAYNGLRQNAFAMNGARGFGSAPSGFAQSAQNALTLGQGQAQQQAYNQGIENTQQQRQNAAAGETGLYGQSIGGEAANTNAATNSAFDQSRMGSTLSDVAQGIGAAASIASGLGGLSLPSGNFFSGAGTPPIVPTPTTYNLASSMPNFPTNPVQSGSGVGSY